jgi:ATP-dependent RNA helicase HrpB
VANWEPLPVDEAIPALRAALAAGKSAVLQAPPGAGKTTHVPLALMNESWLAGSKVIMLEPRRVAARAVTHRMAQLLGERAGETVGYRVRRDTRVGPETRVEVVTEGVLTRMLQTDPTLDGVGLLIFDEFHERSIHADTGLALALHSRALVRPDLRILVMSATLDGARVARLLGDADVITSEGRAFPISISYGVRPDVRSLPDAVASTVMHALDADDGDVLVFLPGGSEIRRVAALLERRVPAGVRVERLYGDLSQQSQDAAIARAPDGARKIILSTPIAETSLTIEDVRIVVDSGLARSPRFSARTGMTRLETVRISQSSAHQRAGRAGRTAPGKCYRLWPENEQEHLIAHSSPEILQADLAPLVLDLAVAGVRDPLELEWLDPPPEAALKQGTALLSLLGALDESGSVTAHGREMATLPVHPRIAHMLLTARSLGAMGQACDIAAMLEERDFLRGVNRPADADIGVRLDILRAPAERETLHGDLVDVGLARRIVTESGVLRRQLRATSEPGCDVSPGVVLALAYPDRIGQARTDAAGGRFLLRNGAGAVLTHPQGLSSAEFIVAADVDGDARSARIFLGASLTRSELDAYFPDQIETENIVEWDDRARTVRARSRVRIGSIVLKDVAANIPDDDAAVNVLLDVVRHEGIAALPWSDEANLRRMRIAFLRTRDRAWPDVSDGGLMERVGDWLAPLLVGRMSLNGMGHDLDRALAGMLDWRQRESLDKLAPVHYVAPTGTRVAIDYANPVAPSIAVRLQEMFGVRDTPTVDGGRVSLTVQLLSPARRPVQVTRDLAGFWSGSYFDVRKELRGRYPKHVWPDDPLTATATSRAKRRGD